MTTAVVAAGIGRTFATGRGSRARTTVALTEVELTVSEGEFVSLIGPSGCGKSTLLRLIADLDSPSTGTLEVFGKSARQARLDHDYGIAFQQAGLLPWRTVADNVALPLVVHKVDKAVRRSRVSELLDLVGLADFAGHYPDQLSGGMQQRVAIARALAESPKLLLMDEPFGALDEITRERMQLELVRITAETGAACVFVTHSIPEAVFLSDRVVVMSPRPGRIVGIVGVADGVSGVATGPGAGVPRDEAFREAEEFSTGISAVRHLLHGGAPLPAGVEDR